MKKKLIVPLKFFVSGITHWIGSTLPARVVYSLAQLLLVSLVGSALINTGPYLLNLPETIARYFVELCLSRGSCDLTTNMLSLALGVYLVIAIVVMFYSTLAYKPEPGSLDDDVLRAVEEAGRNGITSGRIAIQTDIEQTDVVSILNTLREEGEIERFANGDSKALYRVPPVKPK